MFNTVTDRDRPGEPAPWLPAALRSLAPGRVLVCLLGIAATLLICEFVVPPLTGTEPLPREGWLERPLRQLGEVAGQVWQEGDRRAPFRAALVVLLLAGVWSLVGGFVARGELIHHL